jgi:hypothetical protein
MTKSHLTDERPEPLRIWLLGGFRVSVGARTIEHFGWRLRKGASNMASVPNTEVPSSPSSVGGLT